MFLKTKQQKIEEYLRALRCQEYSHIKNKSLLDHLFRVSTILEDLEAPQYVIDAGMCHSLYSTENFNNQIVDIEDRSVVQNLIGLESERLVFIFCTMSRKSICEVGGKFYYTDRVNETRNEISDDIFRGLLYLILANEIDHINIDNHSQILSRINYYLKYINWLNPTAIDKLSKLKIERLQNKSNKYLKFIAHAGIHIQSTKSITIDPWIYSSNFSNPILQGFEPGQKTIDYQIPESINTTEEIQPDIILVSHWHTHHSPFREIKEFAINKNIILVGPALDKTKLTLIKKNLGDYVFERITFELVDKDREFFFDDIKIVAFTHTHKHHLGYIIETPEVKILHVSDARVNTDENRTDLDIVWEKLDNIRPDYMFISAAGHVNKHLSGIHRKIIENNSLTPFQAAKIVDKVQPLNTAIVGIYNFSMWDSKYEFSYSVEELERAFEWTLSFLSPNINILKPKPGEILSSWNEKASP